MEPGRVRVPLWERLWTAVAVVLGFAVFGVMMALYLNVAARFFAHYLPHKKAEPIVFDVVFAVLTFLIWAHVVNFMAKKGLIK